MARGSRGTIANYSHAKLKKIIVENVIEGTGDITAVIAGTGLDGGATSGAATLTLDLTEVIASDSANRILTSDGDGTLTAESNLSYDGTTFIIGDDTKVNDDLPLYFGSNSDTYIKYRETGDDFLVISGSSKGIVLSGSTIQIAGTLEGASPLKIGGEMQFISQGDSSAFKFGPNGEAKIFYGNDDYFTLSGSANGIVLSGSHVAVDGKLGVGVYGADITDGITLPNTNDSAGQIKASSFLSYSSRRYKENIKKLENPLKVIQSLEGVSYKWKNSGRNDFGFIAEDVGKILPGIVQWEINGKDATGIDYSRIISYLVEAVKEQQVQIEKLNQQLDLQDEK